jgi:hypothetical protein
MIYKPLRRMLKVKSSNISHDEVYWIQPCIIEFVSDLRQVNGFLWVLLYSYLMWVQTIDQTILTEVLGETKVFFCPRTTNKQNQNKTKDRLLKTWPSQTTGGEPMCLPREEVIGSYRTPVVLFLCIVMSGNGIAGDRESWRWLHNYSITILLVLVQI